MVTLVPATSLAAGYSKKAETMASAAEIGTTQPKAQEDAAKRNDRDQREGVSREEVDQRLKAILDRLDQKASQQVQVGPPQFTDAG